MCIIKTWQMVSPDHAAVSHMSANELNSYFVKVVTDRLFDK